jgi:signal peptidase I
VAVLFGIAVTSILGLGERLAVKTVDPRVPSPRLLVEGFPFACSAHWLCLGIALVLLLTRFGSVQLAGSGMAPTLGKGERAVYHRRVDPERLNRGTVILYRLSSHSAWGTAGWLVVSRILAVPGDRLSIREGQYLVNGESGPPVGETGQYAPVIQVPLAPAALTVPENRYFIVQDDPANGLDRRVVEASDVTSTSLYYLRASSVLKVID